MSRCGGECLLLAESAAAMPVEDFHEALTGCNECPLLSGESAASLKLLAQKAKEAGRLLRKQRNETNKLRAEVGELGAAASRYEDRVQKLELLHQASTRELEEQVELSRHQEQTLRELSAPILRLSRGVIALPVIGQVDRARADVMMNKLLGELATRHVRHAILDLTGVDSIDAETADHLLRILSAGRLLGAEVLLTGLRGEVARMLVGLDFDPTSVTTLSTVEEALKRCMAKPRG